MEKGSKKCDNRIAHPKKSSTKSQRNNKEDALCKFYNNGRCNKSDAECKFHHPKICRRFNQFGSKDRLNKGCDGNCGFFHPNVCRNSQKDRTCTYKECRFFHLKDTKITRFQDKHNRKFNSNSSGNKNVRPIKYSKNYSNY